MTAEFVVDGIHHGEQASEASGRPVLQLESACNRPALAVDARPPTSHSECSTWNITRRASRNTEYVVSSDIACPVSRRALQGRLGFSAGTSSNLDPRYSRRQRFT